MGTSAPTKLRGRIPKRLRSAEELAALAQLFAADWRHGDSVMTWIRRHEGMGRELSKLVKDGWSWGDLGRALAKAGIVYRTGTPISAITLRNKAWAARKAAEGEGVQAVESAAAPLPRFVPVASLPPGQTANQEDEEPAFQIARLAGHSGKRVVDSFPPPPPEPSTKNRAADILARFTGKR